VLRLGGAAVLNLSLLSSDLWAAAARVVLFGEPRCMDAACLNASAHLALNAFVDRLWLC